MDNIKKRPTTARTESGEVDFYAVPSEWDDDDGMEFLEEAHEALLKLQQKTHKRAQHKRTKPIEGWH